MDVLAFGVGKWGEKIASRGDPAADKKGSTRVEMADIRDRGGFFSALMQNSCCSFMLQGNPL